MDECWKPGARSDLDTDAECPVFARFTRGGEIFRRRHAFQVANSRFVVDQNFQRPAVRHFPDLTHRFHNGKRTRLAKSIYSYRHKKPSLPDFIHFIVIQSRTDFK